MARDQRQELADAFTATRQALKGLQRQARAALQLTTDLEERVDAYERSLLANPTAQEAQDNGITTDKTLALAR